MKSHAMEFAFAAAALTAFLGFSQPGHADTFNPDGNNTFTLNYDMTADPYFYPVGPTYTSGHYGIQFPDSPDHVTDTIQFDFFDHLGNALGTDTLDLSIYGNLFGIGTGFDLTATTTDPVGYVIVTLFGTDRARISISTGPML